MRHRETVTGAFDHVEERNSFTRSDPSKPFTVKSYSKTYTGKVSRKSIDDKEIPGFHRLQKCGEFLPFNPVVITTRTETRTAGSGDFTHYTGNPPWVNAYDSGPYWSFRQPAIEVPVPDHNKIVYVVNAAAAEARGTLWDALTFIGEGRETVNMIRDRFLAITRFAERSASRARGKRRLVETFNQYWLEYRYGWRPLLFDAKQALQALSADLEKGKIINGTSSQFQDLSQSKVSNYPDPYGEWTCTEVISGTRTYRGAFYGRITDPQLARFGQDPLVTAWNLITYSFVVDWFIDVNSYLQALSPLSRGGELLGGGASIRDHYTYTQDQSCSWNKGGASGSFGGLSTKIEVDSYTRTPEGVSSPGWNPRLNTVRLVDLASLILQRASRVFRILHGK